MTDEFEGKELGREVLEFAGQVVEKNIIAGEDVIIPEVTCKLLREGLIMRGVDGGVIREKGGTEHQAARMVEAVGKERIVDLVTGIVKEIVKLPSGEVVKGENQTPEDFSDLLDTFVREFVEGQLDKEEFSFRVKKYKKEGAENKWKVNAVYRVQATMSSLNSLIYILWGGSTEEDLERQKTDKVLVGLRERVLIGAEKSGKEVDDSVHRSEKVDKKKLRHLPPGSLAIMFQALAELRLKDVE